MTVETSKGKIRGLDCGSYTVFKGVPYAKPPVGALRWKEPQELNAWEGIFEADHFGPAALQAPCGDPLYVKEFFSDADYLSSVGEDCLYLNIWAPKDVSGKKLPVAFWIHGGAFSGGFSYEKEFDGAAYCERDVILVTVGYRLGVWGFLAHPWLSEESGSSGNYGILDQIAALRWVYENIAAFGGDPHNITVFGQSAGAMSTQALVSSELTGNMIAKAILQSGGSYGGGLHQDILLKDAESCGHFFTDILQVGNLQELREKSPEEILDAMGKFVETMFRECGSLFLVPYQDGRLLKDSYYRLMDEGKIKDIPYLLGSTKDDIMVTEEMKAAGEFSELYRGCIRFSQKLQELGRKPAYVYYFERELPGDSMGAFHSAELWYVFGTLKRCWRPMEPQDEALSARMLDYWTNFMKTGDPNGEGLAEWKPCSKEDPNVFSFR